MSSATPRSWCERPPTYRFTTWRRSETEMTRAFVSRLMRAAVRWRMPVSLVGRLGSGLRWKFARRICVRSRSTTMAPSILESSNRRFAVNEILSGKPSLPAERTVSVSPTQMRAPRWPAMIMSRARRTAVPGAVMAMASSRRSSIVGSFSALAPSGTWASPAALELVSGSMAPPPFAWVMLRHSASPRATAASLSIKVYAPRQPRPAAGLNREHNRHVGRRLGRRALTRLGTRKGPHPWGMRARHQSATSR